MPWVCSAVVKWQGNSVSQRKRMHVNSVDGMLELIRLNAWTCILMMLFHDGRQYLSACFINNISEYQFDAPNNHHAPSSGPAGMQ